jgi:hypothetical protein
MAETVEQTSFETIVLAFIDESTREREVRLVVEE